MNVEQIAEVCHEVNKAYCEGLGDFSQVDWIVAPEWQKQSAIDGVNFHLENPEASPSALHENWLEAKTKDDWTYGAVKDAVKKEHPCYVAFDSLPKDQQAKDFIFRQLVRSLEPYIVTGDVQYGIEKSCNAELQEKLERVLGLDFFDEARMLTCNTTDCENDPDCPEDYQGCIASDINEFVKQKIRKAIVGGALR